MQPFESIRQYCTQVCDQIRWKKAKPVIAAEIESHLCDQRDAYMAGGDDETAATEKAIVQMGDAVSIGEALDKAHKPSPQWLMIFLTGAFILLGMAANYWVAATAGGIPTFAFWPYAVAFCLFLLFYFLDFTVFGKIATQSYLFVLLFSLLGLVLKSSQISGRLAWSIGALIVEMEPFTLLFPFAFALLVYGMRNKGLIGILLCGAGYIPFAVISLLIPTLSGLFLYTLVSLAVLCLAISGGWFGVNKKQGLLLVLIPTALVFCITAMLAILAGQRYWNIFFHPQEDKLGAGYLHALLRAFLSEAVFFGKGGVPGEYAELAAFPYMGAHYTLVYLVHHFGFIVLLCLVLCIAVFSAVGIYRACKQKSMLGALLALTVIGSFALQCVFYIVENLGYGIITPLSLPLLSYGKAELFLNAAMVGVMLSVFRTGAIVRDSIPATLKKAACKENNMFSLQDGKLIINFRAGRV